MLNCGDEDSVAAAALPDGLTADAKAEETIAEREEETSTKSELEASKRTRGAAGSTQ